MRITFGQLNQVKERVGANDSQFSRSLGFSQNWYWLQRKRYKKNGELLGIKTSGLIAEVHEEALKQIIGEQNHALVISEYEKRYPKAKVVEINTPKKAPNKAKRSDLTMEVKRRLVGILNEQAPLDMNLNDETLDLVVKTAIAAHAA